jgi:1-acyl-sn-glycerol-3-phosphate acyltransferase
VLPFRPSLLASLYPPLPGIRVQPVALDYGPAGDDIAWVGEETAGANARRILSRPGTIPLHIRFLEPIDPASVPDRKALAAAARAKIVESLGSESPGDRL